MSPDLWQQRKQLREGKPEALICRIAPRSNSTVTFGQKRWIFKNIAFKMPEKDYKKLFGENLRRLRDQRKMSLLESDYQSELNESNISKYEHGKRDLRLSTIIKLAKMLKVHPKELFNFDFDPNK
jgi:DNA-binding Xre family transcriptional regulator